MILKKNRQPETMFFCSITFGTSSQIRKKGVVCVLPLIHEPKRMRKHIARDHNFQFNRFGQTFPLFSVDCGENRVFMCSLFSPRMPEHSLIWTVSQYRATPTATTVA
jgi:hypothetical protein